MVMEQVRYINSSAHIMSKVNEWKMEENVNLCSYALYAESHMLGMLMTIPK